MESATGKGLTGAGAGVTERGVTALGDDESGCGGETVDWTSAVGVAPDEAVAEIRDVLDSIGDTCPECPPEAD